MSSAQARIWVVAGAPEAGKSSAAKEFARLLDPPAALLDKDTIYGGFVAAVLRDRLIQRNSPRDDQKLGRYSEFIATVQPSTPPAVSHHRLDNNGEGINTLVAQVTALATRVQTARPSAQLPAK